MLITITWGTGYAPTSVSAFDKALFDAGISNYNIILLSSIIPPNSTIKIRKFIYKEEDYGKRLYAILAVAKENKALEAWAGLGWLLSTKTGKGIVVEHCGNSEDEVRKLINKSIDSIRTQRPELDSSIFSKIVGIKRTSNIPSDSILCSIVCAIIKAEEW